MYGKNRLGQKARLLQEVKPGATTILLPAGLDYVTGDMLVIAPTSFDWREDEYLVVTSYDPESGVT